MVLLPFLRKRRPSGDRVGVALDASGIAVARIVRDAGAPRLAGCAYRALDAHEDPGAALAELARAEQLHKLRANAVLSGADFNLLLVEAPEVDPTELKAAVRWRIKDMLDYHIDDAVIDVFDIPGQRGRARMMYVVVARVGTVQARIDLIEGAGLDLQVIDVPELAQRNLAALLPEDGHGVALLSVSGEEARITLTQDGTLYLARTLEVGSAAFAGFAPAEADGGLALDRALRPEPTLALSDQALEGVILEVQRSLDYYESHFSRGPISHLVMAPLPVEAPGAVERLGAALGLKHRTLTLQEVLPGAADYPPQLLVECLPAIGAALRTEAKAL